MNNAGQLFAPYSRFGVEALAQHAAMLLANKFARPKLTLRVNFAYPRTLYEIFKNDLKIIGDNNMDLLDLVILIFVPIMVIILFFLITKILTKIFISKFYKRDKRVVNLEKEINLVKMKYDERNK